MQRRLNMQRLLKKTTLAYLENGQERQRWSLHLSSRGRTFLCGLCQALMALTLSRTSNGLQFKGPVSLATKVFVQGRNVDSKDEASRTSCKCECASCPCCLDRGGSITKGFLSLWLQNRGHISAM
mmetsp:Transcript_1422/g.2449  ORF Transcript_1422/g.2449 Transcript_1422/m.2449 type:complete len:125 (+) Transcript_1422:557-931(+)